MFHSQDRAKAPLTIMIEEKRFNQQRRRFYLQHPAETGRGR